MRMNAQAKGKSRSVIICFEGNWHGRTLVAQMMSHNVEQRKWIGYQDDGIVHLDFPYPWRLGSQSAEQFWHSQLKKLEKMGISFETDVGGVMLETFQGVRQFSPKRLRKSDCAALFQ